MIYSKNIKQKIVITGSSGYLGFTLYNNLKNNYENILPTTNNLNLLNKNKNFKKAKYGTKKFWNEIIDFADVIIHLAGDTSLYEAEKNFKNNYNSNVKPIKLLLDLIKLKKNKKIKIIFASSITVLGIPIQNLVDEYTQTNPITVYDKNKLNIENLLFRASQNNNIEVVILRLANVFGFGSAKSNNLNRGFINKVMECAINGKDINVYSNGEFFRDYIYIDDVINVIIFFINYNNKVFNIFNIATGKSYLLIDAIKIIIEESFKLGKLSSKINYIPFPKNILKIETRNYKILSRKLQNIYPDNLTTFREGVKKSLTQITKII